MTKTNRITPSIAASVGLTKALNDAAVEMEYLATTQLKTLTDGKDPKKELARVTREYIRIAKFIEKHPPEELNGQQ